MLSWVSQQEYRKYSEYALAIDDQQDDKAVEIKLCSLAKPHMMAFHCSWWGFFVAFFIWFAISPLLSEIQDDFAGLMVRLASGIEVMISVEDDVD